MGAKVESFRNEGELNITHFPKIFNTNYNYLANFT